MAMRYLKVESHAPRRMLPWEALLDAYFLIKKAQALLRLANATYDTAIAERMRDLAAHCFKQAEQLSDDDLAAGASTRPIRRTN
jgi:hypothetical protein